MAEKIHNETKCTVDIAIALSSRKMLQPMFMDTVRINWYNPNFPSVLTSKLPALESKTSSEIVLEHLSALHCARKAFVESEAVKD